MKQQTALAILSAGIVTTLSLLSPALAMNQSDADTLAQSLLQQSQRHCAIIAVPHCGSGELALGFWNRGGANAKGGDSRLLIDAFESDPSTLAAAQAKAGSLGLIGRNMYVRSGVLAAKDYAMPYADNFCDLVAISNLGDADLNNISYAEVERVLCAGAKAWVGRATAEGKGVSAEMLTKWIAGNHALSTATVVSDSTGTWAVITKISRLPDTYEGPTIETYGGSYFYNDKKAAWPSLPQWYIKPYGVGNMMPIRGTGSEFRLSILASGGGRLYGSEIGGVKTPVVSAAAGVHYGFQDFNPLCAIRAYNGQFLWRRKDLSGAILAYSRGLVCNNRIVDGETGDPALDKTIPLPGGTVCWNAVSDDVYYAVISNNGKNTLFAYNLIKNTTVYNVAGFNDDKPFAEPELKKNKFFADLDVFYRERPTVLAGGKIYSFSDSSVYCTNLLNGSKIWGPVKAPEAINFLRASESGVVLQLGDLRKGKTMFLSAADGSVKWESTAFKDCSYDIGLPATLDIGQSDSFNKGREFIISYPGDGSVLDLLTGNKLPQSVPYRAEKGGCGRARMTPAGTYARNNGIVYSFAMGAVAAKGANTYLTPCGKEGGPFATDGMTIYENKGCACYGVILGTKSEAPRGSFDSEQPALESERLEKGTAYDNLSAKVMPDALDWPTHRANNSRSASTSAKVATNECVQLWKYTTPTPNAYTGSTPDDHIYTYQDVTPPVTAGGYTYVAGGDGILKCFENATGKNVWNYTTGGWIFGTPSIANGCVYVGSGDGYAYCIEAHTGRLVWRFRAAPAERRFNYFGHLISTWPILTGVLVQNGMAYFESGIRDEYGVQAYAVDARTGSLAKGWQNTRVGVHWVDKPGLGRIGHIPGGYMTIIGSKLYVKEPARPIGDMCGEKDWMNNGQPQRYGVFDLQTGAMPSADNMRMKTRVGEGELGRNIDTEGRQIGAFGDYLIGWGESLHSEMGNKQYGGDISVIQINPAGNPVQPFIHLVNDVNRSGKDRLGPKINCIAWDNTYVFIGSERYDASDWRKLLDSTIQSGKDLLRLPPAASPQWKPSSGAGSSAMALTANCLVGISAKADMRVLDRQTGSQIFRVSTDGDIYLQGVAVDRNGRIIVTYRNGDVACFGSTHAVGDAQPTR